MRRTVLRDLGLLLLALAAVVAVGAVLFRPVTPEPAPTPAGVPVAAAPRPSSAHTDVSALFVGADLLLGSPSVAELTAKELGWRASVEAVPGSGFVAGDSYVERVPALLAQQQADVVVLSSTSAPAESADLRRLGGNAQFVLDEVRRTLPAARVVVLGPVASGPEATAQRDVLLRVAARFGAVFVDPAGSGYLKGEDALTADGTLTAEASAAFAQRLGQELARVLPPTLLPGATPSG